MGIAPPQTTSNYKEAQSISFSSTYESP
jgi:hypothetical protein